MGNKIRDNRFVRTQGRFGMVVSGLLTAEYTAWAVIMLRVGRKKDRPH